jgi:hypothetical protein
MGKLRDLLTTEAEKFRKEKEKRQQTLNEWMGLLGGLFNQIDVWLKASDPDGLLDVTAETATINDPALGEYKAPIRRIALGDKSVEIVPRARYVVASIRPPGAEKPVRAQGLVEIRAAGWASYYLFQLPGGNWYIQTASHNVRGFDNPVQPLDPDRFEAALASLLG